MSDLNQNSYLYTKAAKLSLAYREKFVFARQDNLEGAKEFRGQVVQNFVVQP